MTGEQIVELVKWLVGAIITAIPGTMMAYAAYRQSLKSVEKSEAAWVTSIQTGVKMDANTKLTETIIEKADEIKVTTNGHLSDVTAQLKASNTRAEVATARIEGLEKLVASMLAANTAAKELADKKQGDV